MRRTGMKNWFSKAKYLVSGLMVAVLIVAASPISISWSLPQALRPQTIGNGKLVLTIGDIQAAKAAGSVDYVTDGTDDQVQFQAALAVLASHGGGELYVLSANYSISAQDGITPSSNTTIRGVGPAATIKRSGNFSRLISINGTSGVTIENLTIDGVVAGVGKPGGGGSIYITQSSNATIKNVAFMRGWNHTLEINRSQNVLVSESRFSDSAGDDYISISDGAVGGPGGVAGASTTRNVLVEKSSFIGLPDGNSGVEIDDGPALVTIKNNIFDQAVINFHIHNTEIAPSQIRVEGNTFSNGSGIDINKSDTQSTATHDVVIVNNIIQTGGKITVNQAYNVLISNNILNGSITDHGSGLDSVIYLQNAVHDVTISNNVIYDSYHENVKFDFASSSSMNDIAINGNRFITTASSQNGVFKLIVPTGKTLTRINIRDNEFIGTSGVWKIGVYFDVTGTIDQFLLAGNSFNSSAMDYAFWLRTRVGGALSNGIVTNNNVSSVTASTRITEQIQGTHTNVKIFENIGWVSENTGSSTGTGAQQTIAHGLNFTPTKQRIGVFRGSANSTAYQSAAPDATNIYVTDVLGGAWQWATVGQ